MSGILQRIITVKATEVAAAAPFIHDVQRRGSGEAAASARALLQQTQTEPGFGESEGG